MAKARSAPALEPHEALQAEISELRTEVANLRAYVQVANEILDGIREDLQWVTQNGIEIREPSGYRMPIPVLKGMALDPAGDDWGEKLDINYGVQSPRPNDVSGTLAEPSSPADQTAEPAIVDAAPQPTVEISLPTSTASKISAKTDDQPASLRPRSSLF